MYTAVKGNHNAQLCCQKIKPQLSNALTYTHSNRKDVRKTETEIGLSTPKSNMF